MLIIFVMLYVIWWFSGKESTCQCRRQGFNAWVRKIPWRRNWHPTPVLLPRESHGQRSPAGYCPWGRTESDMTEATCMHAYNPLFKIGKYILLVDVLEHSQEMKEQSIHIYIGWWLAQAGSLWEESGHGDCVTFEAKVLERIQVPALWPFSQPPLPQGTWLSCWPGQTLPSMFSRSCCLPPPPHPFAGLNP